MSNDHNVDSHKMVHNIEFSQILARHNFFIFQILQKKKWNRLLCIVLSGFGSAKQVFDIMIIRHLDIVPLSSYFLLVSLERRGDVPPLFPSTKYLMGHQS